MRISRKKFRTFFEIFVSRPIDWVADCYFIANVLDLPFASPIAIYC